MTISVFDLFSIGIGPSSSHTMGPMQAAKRFVQSLRESSRLSDVVRVKAEMFGPLGATGKGHGTPKAVMLGLEGEDPETVDVDSAAAGVITTREDKCLSLAGSHRVNFNESDDLLLHRPNPCRCIPTGCALRPMTRPVRLFCPKPIIPWMADLS